eukprot:4149685-Amphidinium_carterae.2
MLNGGNSVLAKCKCSESQWARRSSMWDCPRIEVVCVPTAAYDLCSSPSLAFKSTPTSNMSSAGMCDVAVMSWA